MRTSDCGNAADFTANDLVDNEFIRIGINCLSRADAKGLVRTRNYRNPWTNRDFSRAQKKMVRDFAAGRINSGIDEDVQNR